MDFIPLNLAELSVAALVIIGFILGSNQLMRSTPAIIDRWDAYKANRAKEKQAEDDAERAAIREAQEHSRAVIEDLQATLGQAHKLQEQSNAQTDRLLKQLEKKDEAIDNLEAEMAGLRANYQDLLPIKGEVEALRRQLTAAETTNKERQKSFEDKIKALEKENHAVIAERDELKSRVQALEEDKRARNGDADSAPKSEDKAA